MDNKKITIVLVDDNDDTRNGTMRLLEYEDEVDVVGFAENGAIAIERVREHRPDVVLMDINMPVMNGIEATGHLSREFPMTQVIMVSVQDEAHYLREAFRAGAVDFVAKPISSSELVEAIKRAYAKRPTPQEVAPPPPTQMMQQQMMPTGPAGKMISILGLKGGVGKTTMAINLAVGLANAGKNTLLIDANVLFGDVAVSLNTRSQYSVTYLGNMAQDPTQLDTELIEGVITKHESGLSLLLAPDKPSEADPVNQAGMTNLFDFLRNQYEYLIVDTSVNFDEVLVACISSADKLAVIAAPDMPSLKDSRLLFRELKEFEIEDEDIMLILNKVEKNGRITPDQITNFLGHEVLTQIPLDPSMTDILNQGVPAINQNARKVLSVRAFQALTELVIEKAHATAEGV